MASRSVAMLTLRESMAPNVAPGRGPPPALRDRAPVRFYVAFPAHFTALNSTRRTLASKYVGPRSWPGRK